MNSINFPQANCSYCAPPGLDESQVKTIPAWRGRILGGNLDGLETTVAAWLPSKEELQALNQGAPVFLSVIGGLPPHFLSVCFPYPPESIGS